MVVVTEVPREPDFCDLPRISHIVRVMRNLNSGHEQECLSPVVRQTQLALSMLITLFVHPLGQWS